MNTPDETGVNIIITGDATRAATASTHVSAAITKLRVDLAGLSEETQRQMGIIAPPAERISPPASLEPARIDQSSVPIRAQAVAEDPSSQNAPSDEPARNPSAVGQTGETNSQIRAGAPPLTPTPPVIPAPNLPASTETMSDSLVRQDHGPQAGQTPALMSHPSTRTPIDSAPGEIQKLKELHDATASHSARTNQMLDALIQSHRVAAQIHARQNAEIDALKTHLRTLLAQVGNHHFNTQ